MNEYPYVSIDVETTGFSSSDEIIEVCAIEFNLKGDYGRIFHHLLKPEHREIPEVVTELTGIDNEIVKLCPIYASIKPDLEHFIDGREIVAHNLAFDLRFLKIESRKSHCTMTMCRKAQTQKLSNKLIDACNRYNIDWELGKAHRANYDALKTAQLFGKLKFLENCSNV